MPSAARATFSCPSCGKTYTAKPELAGKKVRCVCGTVLSAPELIPPSDSPAPLEPVEDDLYGLADDPPPVARPIPAEPVYAPAMPISIPGLEDDAYTCPSCNKSMLPGAIVCTHCGFNLKTGAKTKVAVAGAQPRARAGKVTSIAQSPKTTGPGSVFSSIPRRKEPVVIDDKKDQFIKILLPIVVLLLVVGAVIGYRMISHSARSASTAAISKGEDAKVAELMEEDGATEIHQWYEKDHQRIAGPYNESQALSKADDLQKMGAKKVLAFGSRMTRVLAVELPEDLPQRKALFAWESKFAIDHRYKPAKDEGQKYLLLDLGL